MNKYGSRFGLDRSRITQACVAAAMAFGLPLLGGCDGDVRSYGGLGGGGAGQGSGGGGGGVPGVGGAGQGGADQGGAGQGGATGVGGSGGSAPSSAAMLPVAPTTVDFAWQGSQTRFLNANGVPCTGLVSIAVGDQAVCYSGPGGALRCAGNIYTHVYGTQFVDVGIAGVEQILLSPTFNSPTGNGICVTTAAEGAHCMGDYNGQGQFANGVSTPSDTFVLWGGIPEIRRLATGTWDQFCAMDGVGFVHCAGYNFGKVPALQGGMMHKSVWVDTFGMMQLDAPDVLRAEAGRAECTVTIDGFECLWLAPKGGVGQVVDGTGTHLFMPESADRACVLTSDGKVTCYTAPMGPGGLMTESKFLSGTVLALAGNFYTDTLCAVYNDGSIWCVGNNSKGKLGTGNELALAAETMVLPPGSVDLTCK